MESTVGIRTSAADYLLFWKLLSRKELDQLVCAVNTHSIHENIRGKSILKLFRWWHH